MKAVALDQPALGRALMVYSASLLVAALGLTPTTGHAGIGIASVAVALLYLAGAVARVHERPAARWLITVAAASHFAVALVWASHLRLLPAW